MPFGGPAGLLPEAPLPLPPDEQPAAAASRASPATAAARPPARFRRRPAASLRGSVTAAGAHDSGTTNSLCSGQVSRESRLSSVPAGSSVQRPAGSSVQRPDAGPVIRSPWSHDRLQILL